MTYFKEPVISLFCTIITACLLLVFWSTLAYVVLTLIVTYLLVRYAQRHPQLTQLITQFVTEFLGFALILLTFAGLITIMGAFFT